VKLGVILLSMIISLSAFGHTQSMESRDSVRRVEREKARIEKKKNRIMNQWDERTLKQRKTDRRMLVFLAVGAAVLVNSIAYKE